MGGASAHVADHLRQLILDGTLKPGERVPQEIIAQQTGASRLPVREAMRTLEGEGLVSLEPNKGARVTSLDPHELDLLYSTRASVEPLVIADSLPNLTDDAIQETGAILDRIEGGVTLVDFLLLDRDFHLLTYSGCRSQHLLSIVQRLWNSTQQYRRAFATSTGSSWREVTNLEHRLLHLAVAERNSEVAASIVRTHITRTRTALRRHVEVFESDPTKAVSSWIREPAG